MFLEQERKKDLNDISLISPKLRGIQQDFLMDTEKKKITFSEQKNPSIQVLSDGLCLTNLITFNFSFSKNIHV